MLPEKKKREMRFSVLARLKANGMPAPTEMASVTEAEDEEEEEDNEEGMPEEKFTPPVPTSGGKAKPKKLRVIF